MQIFSLTSKTALILTQKQYQDIRLQLLQFSPRSYRNSVRKLSHQVLLRADLVTPSQGKVHWKWFLIVEVNGAYLQGRYERFPMKSFGIISNAKIFAMQDGLPANRVNMTNHIDLYVPHMDQKALPDGK